MTESLPNPRYERKLVVPARTVEEVRAVVRRHPAAFFEVYPPREINNVYLDTPSLADYHDHVIGAPNRVKTRVRWYGPFAGPLAKPALERKLKQGLVGGKLTYRLPPLPLNGAAIEQQLQAAFDATPLPEALRAELRHRQPALFNRYRRHYFLSGDRHVRLTVDWALQFGRVGRGPVSDRCLTPCTPLFVVELKYEPEYASQVAAITNLLPFRLSRSSKYVLGIERVVLP
jgi:hypothetical protein